MIHRHALLGLALAATAAVAGGATVWAGEDASGRELRHAQGDAETLQAEALHGPGARHRRHGVPVVVDRRSALRRVDRLIEGLQELDRIAARSEETITIEIRRLLREEHGGESPVSRGADDGRERPLHDVADRVREALGRRDRRGADHDRGDAHEDMRRHIDRMRRDLVALHEELQAAPPAVVAAPVVVIEAASPRVFAEYTASLARLSFEDDRLERLEDYARHTYFTSTQVATIVRRYIAFDEYEAARILYPRMVDPENVHRVYDAMRWQSDLGRFRDFVRKHDR